MVRKSTTLTCQSFSLSIAASVYSSTAGWRNVFDLMRVGITSATFLCRVSSEGVNDHSTFYTAAPTCGAKSVPLVEWREGSSYAGAHLFQAESQPAQ
jgi:hypothetical protein